MCMLSGCRPVTSMYISCDMCVAVACMHARSNRSSCCRACKGFMCAHVASIGVLLTYLGCLLMLHVALLLRPRSISSSSVTGACTIIMTPARICCRLVEAAGPDSHVIRVMPNTPCLVGETAAAMCLGGKVSRVSHFCSGGYSNVLDSKWIRTTTILTPR